MKKSIILGITVLILAVTGNHAFALCVNSQEANVRQGPGTNFKKTWEVFKYMPFKKVSKKGAWYKVKDVDNDIHWIYGKLITTSFKCAVVKVDKANIRSGPGLNFDKKAASPALKYDSFKVEKTNTLWVKVEDEFGDTGWIYKKLLWIQ